jgi:hypothetical protein
MVVMMIMMIVSIRMPRRSETSRFDALPIDDDLDGQGLRWFDVHLVDNRIRIIVQGLRGLACIRSV